MACCGGGFGRMGGMGGGLTRGRFGAGRMQDQDPGSTGSSLDEADPESILKARLARGEITVEEYRALRQALTETAF